MFPSLFCFLSFCVFSCHSFIVTVVRLFIRLRMERRHGLQRKRHWRTYSIVCCHCATCCVSNSSSFVESFHRPVGPDLPFMSNKEGNAFVSFRLPGSVSFLRRPLSSLVARRSSRCSFDVQLPWQRSRRVHRGEALQWNHHVPIVTET